MMNSASQRTYSQSCCQSHCSPLSLISIVFLVAIPVGEFLDYFTDQDWEDAKPLDWVFFSLFLVITSALCIGVHRWAINKVKKTSDLSKATLFLAPQCPVFLYMLCNTIKLIAEWLIEGEDAKEEFGQENLQNAILASFKQEGFLITTGLMLSTQIANVRLDGIVWRRTQSALGFGEDNTRRLINSALGFGEDNTRRLINGDEALQDRLLNVSGSYSSRAGDSSTLSQQPSFSQ